MSFFVFSLFARHPARLIWFLWCPALDELPFAKVKFGVLSLQRLGLMVLASRLVPSKRCQGHFPIKLPERSREEAFGVWNQSACTLNCTSPSESHGARGTNSPSCAGEICRNSSACMLQECAARLSSITVLAALPVSLLGFMLGLMLINPQSNKRWCAPCNSHLFPELDTEMMWLWVLWPWVTAHNSSSTTELSPRCRVTCLVDLGRSRPSVVSEFVSAGATACTFAHKAAVMHLAKLTAWTVLEIWTAPTVCLRACANFVPAGG